MEDTMKIFKYLAAALLIVSITKKIHVSSWDGKKWSGPGTIRTSLKKAKDRVNVSQQSVNTPTPFSLQLTDKDSKKVTGLYNPNTGTATIQFTNVVKYDRATTPPNILNSKLIRFGSYPTPGYIAHSGMVGGLSKTTSLWGIATSSTTKAATGQAQPSSKISNKKIRPKNIQPQLEFQNPDSRTLTIKLDENTRQTYVGVTAEPTDQNPSISFTAPAMKFIMDHGYSNQFGRGNLYGIPVTGIPITVKSNDGTAGHYWKDQKIVQCNDGTTFVAIIEEHNANYTKRNNDGKGPVWTWFDHKDLAPYGISPETSEFKNLAQKVGSIVINKQTYILYGVMFNKPSKFTAPGLLNLGIGTPLYPGSHVSTE
jgi:hypothetical protein